MQCPISRFAQPLALIACTENACYCASFTQVAVGRRPFLNVYGGDYNTPDGTGVRDFIHVVDLADGHVKALDRINEKCGCKAYNLGTGTGYSVLDMVKAMEDACGKKIEYKIVVCWLFGLDWIGLLFPRAPEALACARTQPHMQARW